MPGHLRSRLRRAFTGEEGHGPLSKIKGSKSAKHAQEESDYYQPGEKMPPLKYRRPVAPEHKAKLEAFSFSNAWRRRSHHSLYSPMGSRLPSRKSSFRSRRSRSRSIHRSRRSSLNSVHSEFDDEEWVDSGIGTSIAGDDRPAKIKEASDDEGDVLNVGLSRNATQDPRDTARRRSSTGRRSSSVRRSSRPGTASDRTATSSQPFTPEDLESALQKSNLEATKEESIQSATTPSEASFDDPSPFLRPRGGSIYVPYNGQGTPPELPFWGNAYPDGDDAHRAQFRRESIFLSSEGSDCASSDRRGSVFAPSERRGSVFAPSERRPSVFVPNVPMCDENSERQTANPLSTVTSAPAMTSAATSAPIDTPAPKPVRKPIVSCPSEDIMKILARKDL